MEKNNKEKIHIYFIENHVIINQVKLEFENMILSRDLKVIFQDKFNKNDITYTYSIYKFQFFPSEKIFEAKIILIDEKNNKFYFNLNVKDYDKDIFLYDFKFNPQHNIFSKNFFPPKSYPLSHQEQFDLYIKYISLSQNKNEKINLILSTQKLLIEGEKYTFCFYLLVLLECFNYPAIRNHLLLFNPDKIERTGEINTEKIKLLNNILQISDKNSFKYLDKIVDQKEKEKCYENFKIIVFTFYSLFNEEKFNYFLDNKDFQNNIYNILLDHNNLFEKNILPEEKIQILIDKVSNYNKLTKGLMYNHGILQLLQIIKKNFDKICLLYKNELKEISKKKVFVIKIEAIAIPNKDDNLEEISILYIDLINLQMNKVNTIFLLFSENLCMDYIRYFDKKNLKNLLCIKNIIRALKKDCKIDLELKDINFDNIIHETGLELSKNKKLTNNEILDFINNDIIYNKSSYKNESSLEILSALDIRLIDEKFCENWRKINWNDIFGENYLKFLEKISSFIVDIKDFNILFKLFNISKNKENKFSFDIKALKLLQNKFINFTKNLKDEKSEIYNEVLAKLIYYSEINKYKVKNFLNDIVQNNINYDIINKAYINLFNGYKDQISTETKKIIKKYFVENLNKTNFDAILFLIDNYSELYSNIFKRIEKMIIVKNEFWKKEESDNLQLFKGLLARKYIKEENMI